jgi:hypothetical protein
MGFVGEAILKGTGGRFDGWGMERWSGERWRTKGEAILEGTVVASTAGEWSGGAVKRLGREGVAVCRSFDTRKYAL